MAKSPVSIPFSTDGVELAVKDATALPSNARGQILTGLDGSTTRFVNVDSFGRVLVVGAGVAGTPAGGVFSVQGVASGTAVAVSDGGGSLTIDGTITANQGGSWTVAATQSGTWTNAQGTGAGAAAPWSVRLSDGTTFYTAPSSSQLPSSLVSGRLDVNVGSGTVTANIGTTNGLALDVTLTGGTQKAINRGGAKGATSAADVTSTAEGADHQALDVQVYHGGTAINPTAIRALTTSDVVTAAQGAAAGLAGYWPVRVTDGTNTMPTGDTAARGVFHRVTDGTNTAAVKAASTPAVATDPALVVAISPNNTLPIEVVSGGYGGQVEGLAADGSTAVGNPVYMGGKDGTTVRSLLVDSLGRIITAPAGSSTAVTPGLAPGYVSTAAIARVAVRSTAYTEQTTNAQRSIVSANAADAAAGTGARTVSVTYYTATFTGPFTEVITLNGTTPVNTVATNICYIEKMEVLTVGSGGQNVGIISLKAATAGGGVTIASIAAGDNETFYAHHYVATGVTCYVTGMSVGHNGTTVGSGALYILRAQALGVANAVDNQIGDFVRLYGQSSTISRVWGTALKVPGPARITMYVTPESASAFIYRGSMDFYDQ